MTRTVVVGGGIGGLVAARRRALAGDDVVLLEASDRLGGRVAPVRIGGLELDGGAESFATRGGTVAALLHELGLGGDVVEPAASAWVALPDRAVPLPAGGLLGIPSSPLAADVIRVLGARGAARAYADRLLPVLKVGRYERLGPLVRGRMGAAVLERLVAPVVANVYGADPEEVPVDLVAPGLNGAITATGALSSAVLRLRTAAPAGSAAQGLVGGVHRLVPALAGTVPDVRTGTPALGIHPVPDGAWVVVTAREDLRADRVVLAADGQAALGLLTDAAPQVAAMDRPEPAPTRAVLVLVDDPRLDRAPRGSGVLRAPATAGIAATALTHVTAKWPWVARGLGPGRHVLRLAYRGGDEVPDAVVLDDLRALLGVDVVGAVERVDVIWWDGAPPLDPRTVALRRALEAAPLSGGLAVAGSWTGGTGLAAVVAGAERAAAG